MSDRGRSLPHALNPLGQPIGLPVPDWAGAALPPRTALVGRTCRLDPLVPSQAPDLVAAYAADETGDGATYLPYGPFRDVAELEAFILQTAIGPDRFYAITLDGDTAPSGFGSFLRIAPADGAIEIGNLYFAPRLQRTTASTEALYLMLAHAIDDLGYRRVEWKCNALNAPSCRAAERLGFTFEGIFRQATVVRGRNRDTAWYAIIDADWPQVGARLRAWLAQENFDGTGQQLQRLEEIDIAG